MRHFALVLLLIAACDDATTSPGLDGGLVSCDDDPPGIECAAECFGSGDINTNGCCQQIGFPGDCWSCDDGELRVWRELAFLCYEPTLDAAPDASVDAAIDAAVDALPDAAL